MTYTKFQLEKMKLMPSFDYWVTFLGFFTDCHKDCYPVYNSPSTLQVDWDDGDKSKEIEPVLAEIGESYGILGIDKKPSFSPNSFHVTIKLAWPILDRLEQIKLQRLLLSDPIRENFNEQYQEVWPGCPAGFFWESGHWKNFKTFEFPSDFKPSYFFHMKSTSYSECRGSQCKYCNGKGQEKCLYCPNEAKFIDSFNTRYCDKCK